MIVHIINDLVELGVVDLDLSLVEGLSQFDGGDVPCLVLVHAHEHFSKILDVLVVCHFHQEVHGGLFECRDPAIDPKSLEDVGV
jgi:hypothetical protein